MALRAGAARYRYRTQSSRRRLLAVCVILVVVAGLLLAGRGFVFPKTAKAPPLKPVPPLSFEAKQVEDVNLVATAVGQYANANNALPVHLSTGTSGGLVLCGATCDPNLYTVGGFMVYQASNIRLVNYAPALMAPDVNTMYLVPGAKCGSGGQLGDVNLRPRSMVILYVASTASSTEPRCVVL